MHTNATTARAPKTDRWRRADDVYRRGNVALIRTYRGWAMLHHPSRLGFSATWRTLRAAKAGADAIGAEFDLSLIGEDGQMDDDDRRALHTVVRKHREDS